MTRRPVKTMRVKDHLLHASHSSSAQFVKGRWFYRGEGVNKFSSRKSQLLFNFIDIRCIYFFFALFSFPHFIFCLPDQRERVKRCAGYYWFLPTRKKKRNLLTKKTRTQPIGMMVRNFPLCFHVEVFRQYTEKKKKTFLEVGIFCLRDGQASKIKENILVVLNGGKSKGKNLMLPN